MDFGPFDHPQPDVSPAQAGAFVRSLYGVEGTVQPLAGERDRSFLIDTRAGRYVLKIANRGDRPDVLGVQADAIDWALATDPTLPLATTVPTVDGNLIGSHSGYRFQLSEFVHGSPLSDGVVTPGFRRSLGRLAARIGLALAGFDHPALHRSFPWNLRQLPELRPLLDEVDRHRDLIEGELDRFTRAVAPRLVRLPSQAIHGDLNADNLVVDASDPERVAGVFDFGDMGLAPAIVDLAIATTYQCIRADPVNVMVEVATAYHAERALTLEEVTILPDLVGARCAQSLLMSARQLEVNPHNADYIASDVEDMAATLGWLTEANRKRSVDALVDACALGDGQHSGRAALTARHSHMAASYSLSYAEPVHAISAEGVWVVDGEGRRLLDAYNNVPHVGHGHPRVLAALAAQSRRLNTNTRYLVDGVGGYAERLADLLPDPLSVVFFTNSGSEANDLAYRIATTVSGGSAAITSANAYHGATTVTAALSPEEHDVSMFGRWSISVDISRHLGGATSGMHETMAGVDQQLDDSGQAAALVIVDTIFSSEGIHLAPRELLDGLKTWAGDRGALLVADEVQAGFARVGSRFWGFGDVTPDIVTLGKPIGNGYPMGAVVATREIADEFASRSSFFSTFAGSPVATAVGNAVLDVIESEGLAAHADDLGSYLRRSLTDTGHASVMSVRGAGLFIGVELESAQLAGRVVDEMRRRGVLIGRTGPDGNVLKVRPPLVFQRHHADRLLEELSSSLVSLSQGERAGDYR